MRARWQLGVGWDACERNDRNSASALSVFGRPHRHVLRSAGRRRDRDITRVRRQRAVLLGGEVVEAAAGVGLAAAVDVGPFVVPVIVGRAQVGRRAPRQLPNAVEEPLPVEASRVVLGQS